MGIILCLPERINAEDCSTPREYRVSLRQAGASEQTAPQPGPNGTVIFHLQHPWVTGSGDNIYLDPAVATTVAVQNPLATTFIFSERGDRIDGLATDPGTVFSCELHRTSKITTDKD